MGATGQGPQQVGDGEEPQSDDEESTAVLRTVGKVIKMCRERQGMTQAELGAAIRYSEEQVSSVEGGRRAPKPQFLVAADKVLEAGGLIAGLHCDVQLVSRLISDRKEVQILELRYGTIRAQALTPQESLAFIEKLLGET